MKTIVIGGGAAGMMAAIAAARSKDQVLLLEKNEKLGKKIYITGKGRCNCANDCETEEFFSHVVSNPRFLYSSIYGFTKDEFKAFLESRGCALKTERGQRVFPVSDHASDVTKALEGELRRLGVEIRLHTVVAELRILENCVRGVTLENGQIIEGDRVIVATGGLSYPTTGSTGDGYRFAKAAGHTVTDRKPALVPLVTKERWVPELQGLSLKNVRLKLSAGKKKISDEMGEMLFTHQGISGPLVLSASSYYTKIGGNALAELDLKPALTEEQLDARILKDLTEAGKKQFHNALDHLLPKKLIPVVVALSKIDPEKRAIDVTKQERLALVHLLKHMTMTVVGTGGFSEAIITQGGVSVKEIKPDTMESKLIAGLYFAGEVLDVDAVTGGFNLQIAWSTGMAAGRHEA
ncbi:MAG: NAD(P)/FAD-dependent oxidoreductase [Lachnospiraceae bacterium]|nr:NAD(P)/FAD-dependent oxidoreductase [Lachnospiraceae bacterium]